MLKILVPIDFSIYSKYSLDFAMSLLKNKPGSILALHVSVSPVVDNMIDPGEIGVYQTELDRMILAENEKKMAAHVQPYGDRVTSAIKTGNIKAIINDYIEKKRYNLIIAGSRGTSGSKDIFTGSTTRRIIRNADCPVFSIHEPIEKEAIKNIVFASDFHEVSPRLVKQLKMWQRMFNCIIHFVKINTPLHFEKDVEVKKRANKFFEQYDFKKYSFSIYNDHNESDGIVNFSDKKEAGIIALGTHGYRGIRHLMNRNIAENITHNTGRLVWTYKMKDRQKLEVRSGLNRELKEDYLA